MTFVVRWLKLWCKHCGYKTAHQYLPDVVVSEYTACYPRTKISDGGLLWRCERCRRSEVRTAHQVHNAERM